MAESDGVRRFVPRPWLTASELAGLRERLLDPTHEEHEEIVWVLQNHPDDANIPYLKRAIALKPSIRWLRYDDYGSFYNKCFWALQVIATPEAVGVIEECARSADPVLRDRAAYRLRRLAEEGLLRRAPPPAAS